MPSVHQASPYAEPNTPIASAKRPRTAVRHTGTPYTKTGRGDNADLLQSPPPACQLEASSPSDNSRGRARSEGGEEDRRSDRSSSSSSGSAGGGGGAPGARRSSSDEGGGDGTWKGRVVSLFSPVLKFVGGAHEQQQQHQEEAAQDEEEEGMREVGKEEGVEEQGHAGDEEPQQQQQHYEAAQEGHENDSNWENRGGSPQQHQHQKGEDESCHQLEGDEMEVEAPEEPEGEDMEGEELEVVEEFNPFLFIKQLPPYPHVAIPGKICLPQRKYNTRSCSAAVNSTGPAPITLVLDLDETLVHCTVEPVPDPDVVFPVEFNGVSYQVHVRKRPHLEEFLLKVSQMFEVVVFTASQQVYADALLNIIDPGHKLIKHRLFRDACLPVEGNYIKDLNVLGRDITRTVLIDNSPYAYGYQLDNGIPIESWFEDRDDMELLKLLPFLEELQTVDDVRPLIRNAFQSHLRVEEA